MILFPEMNACYLQNKREFFKANIQMYINLYILSTVYGLYSCCDALKPTTNL